MNWSEWMCGFRCESSRVEIRDWGEMCERVSLAYGMTFEETFEPEGTRRVYDQMRTRVQRATARARLFLLRRLVGMIATIPIIDL